MATVNAVIETSETLVCSRTIITKIDLRGPGLRATTFCLKASGMRASHGVNTGLGAFRGLRYTPAVPLLTDLDAFLAEHRRCGDLDGGARDGRVWLACTCAAVISRRDDE